MKTKFKLAISVALVALVAACTLTPEAAEDVASLEAERSALVAERDEIASKSAAAAESDDVTAAVAKLEVLLAEFEAVEAQIAAKTAEIAEVEAADIRGQAEAASAPFLPFIPAPYQGAATGLLALLPWVASKRSRQHLGSAVRDFNPLSGGGMAPGDAIASIAKAFGFGHSNEDPRVLLEVVKKKAAAGGYVLKSDGNGGAMLALPEPTPAAKPMPAPA